MLPRLFIAIGLACIAALCVATPTACSSSQRRDQNYGTDKGADYRPEAGVFDGSSDDALDSDDADDATVSGDRPRSLDTPLLADTPLVTDTPAESDAPLQADTPAESDAPSETDTDTAS